VTVRLGGGTKPPSAPVQQLLWDLAGLRLDLAAVVEAARGASHDLGDAGEERYVAWGTSGRGIGLWCRM